MSGFFITFEGIDGAGKSSQAKRLADHFRATGMRVVLTREPGGTLGAGQIRKLLVEGPTGRWSPETEILLFTAARRDHLENVIRPALENGEIVISDRFVDSTRIYQGGVRGDLRDQVDKLHALMIGCEADLTLIIDIDPGLADQRMKSRINDEVRFEGFGFDFQKCLRKGFLRLSEDEPSRCRLIDGSQDENDVAAKVIEAVEAVL